MKKRKSIIPIVFLVFAAVLAAAVLAFPLLIVMRGDSEISIGQNEAFEDPGAYVVFGSGEIKGDGVVDTSHLGDYTVTYSFLTEKRTRTVHVVDRKRPVITLLGALEKYIIKGDEYIEARFIASDENDGDISSLVVVESDLDTQVPGEYHISYTVSDKAGNAARERRKVIVTEEGPYSQDRLSFDLDPFYDDVICKYSPYTDGSDKVTPDANCRYEDMLFFGDSFIGNLGDYGIVSYDQLWSRGSLGTDSVYDAPITVYGYYDGYSTFFDAMDAYHPGTVLVLLNSDRTLQWTAEYLQSSCDSFYKDIKEKYPDTTFIICSITPVDQYYSSDAWLWQEGFDRNDRINKMNAHMCELCRNYGFKFMNVAKELKDPATGCCKNEYIGEDGIHLSSRGYEVMVDYIKNHMDFDH